MLAYKSELLAHETPRCTLERVAVDLSDVAARRELFARLRARATAVMVVSEGLVVYLAPDEATIHEHAKRTGLPANRVSAVRRLIDPTTAD